MNKWVWIGLGVAIMSGLLGWLFIESSKPLPGEKQVYNCDNYIDFSKLQNENISDKCRVHVPVGTEVKYLTNPPTHGPHYAEWVKPGVYEIERDDRNLVHSLEHGYIVMSYRCSQGNMGNQGEATGSGEVDEGCKQRKEQLSQVYEKKGKKKLIVVPKSNLDTIFALTAWSYIDKFDEFDQSRVEKFIDAHKDMGPEKTME